MGSVALSALTVVVLLETRDELSNAEVLDHLLEDLVVLDLDLVDLDLGALWDEVHLSLSFLFLKSEGNASDGSLLDSLHQVGREAGDLVSESLGLDRTDVINDSLIYMEVVGQLSVVLLDKCSGGSLNGLGSYSSHCFVLY